MENQTTQSNEEWKGFAHYDKVASEWCKLFTQEKIDLLISEEVKA